MQSRIAQNKRLNAVSRVKSDIPSLHIPRRFVSRANSCAFINGIHSFHQSSLGAENEVNIWLIFHHLDVAPIQIDLVADSRQFLFRLLVGETVPRWRWANTNLQAHGRLCHVLPSPTGPNKPKTEMRVLTLSTNRQPMGSRGWPICPSATALKGENIQIFLEENNLNKVKRHLVKHPPENFFIRVLLDYTSPSLQYGCFVK